VTLNCLPWQLFHRLLAPQAPLLLQILNQIALQGWSILLVWTRDLRGTATPCSVRRALT
jgi:hypothetical protein